jgi:type IV secretion system protein VirD4
MRWDRIGRIVLLTAVVCLGAQGGLAAMSWALTVVVMLIVAFLRPRRVLEEGPSPLAGARWGTWKDAAPHAARGPFLLGLWGRSRTPLYLTEEQLSGHVLVVGPSRTGKTAGAIAPNLLLRDPARESVVVLDVKTGPRSLWNVTAGRYGARAHLFCPYFEGSIGYNPLSRVDSIGLAQRKATLLVQNTTPRNLSGDAHVYAAATADLAMLLFLHVQQDRPRGGHTVGAVYRLVMGGPACIRETLRSSRVAEVRERHGIFSARERRVQEAAVTGLLERLAPWADPLVVEATARHFDLTALGRRPSALYILMPETDALQQQPLVAWLVADLLDELIELAEREGLRVPVRMYLDEFRQFGYLPGLSESLPTLRERGISVLLGVQVLSQIEEVYGRVEARTLVGNTETKLLFRAGDLETARMISAWLGRTTVPAVSVTTRGRGDRSMTVRPYVRPLMAVEDLTRIPDGAVIALAGAARPLPLWQARYYAIRGLAISPPPFPLRRRPAPPLAVASPDASPAAPARQAPPRPAGGVPGRGATGGELTGA